MRKLIFISILILLIGCGTFQLTTLNHDPLYHIPDSNIQVEVLDTEFDVARKFRNDFDFRYNYSQFAQNQNYSWYFQNRMFRLNSFNLISTQDLYWNRHLFWNVWAFNYPNAYNFNYWNTWNSPFYSQWHSRYTFAWNSWNYRSYRNQFRDNNWNYYNQIENKPRRVANVNGRRGSSSVNSRSATVGNTLVNNQLPIIDRMVNGLRENNKKVRVYINPNNLPPVIRRSNNNTQPTRTINRRTIYNNSRPNQIRRQEVQRNSPPQRSTSNNNSAPTRSNNRSTPNNGRKQQ